MRLLLGVAVLAVAAPLAVAIPAPPASATSYTQTYLQFNMCGNACHKGAGGVVADIERSILSRSPQPFVVTLNEVCKNQFDRLNRDLGRYEGRFGPTGPRCANGQPYGNAILVRSSNFSHLGTWSLPNPGRNEGRRLLCLRIPITGNQPMVACVTHIDYHVANKAAQISKVASIVGQYDANNGVLVGGDFNTRPWEAPLHAMYRSYYSPSGRGIFIECDSPKPYNREYKTSSYNEGTFKSNNRKLDYIFLSRDWSNWWGDATTSSSYFDHRLLWGGATY